MRNSANGVVVTAHSIGLSHKGVGAHKRLMGNPLLDVDARDSAVCAELTTCTFIFLTEAFLERGEMARLVDPTGGLVQNDVVITLVDHLWMDELERARLDGKRLRKRRSARVLGKNANTLRSHGA